MEAQESTSPRVIRKQPSTAHNTIAMVRLFAENQPLTRWTRATVGSGARIRPRSGISASMNMIRLKSSTRAMPEPVEWWAAAMSLRATREALRQRLLRVFVGVGRLAGVLGLAACLVVRVGPPRERDGEQEREAADGEVGIERRLEGQQEKLPLHEHSFTPAVARTSLRREPNHWSGRCPTGCGACAGR